MKPLFSQDLTTTKNEGKKIVDCKKVELVFKFVFLTYFLSFSSLPWLY